MPAPHFLILTFLLALLDWIAAERRWTRLRYFSKPGVLAALIAWFTRAVGWGGLEFWFGLALVFSLLGDIILMLPARFFLPGLVSFLLAHLCYIVGFTQGGLPSNPISLGIVVPIAATGAWVFTRIYAGMRETDQGGKNILPVIAYSITISLMLVSAWLRPFNPALPLNATLCSALGATLFFLSDSVLAYNRFVRNTPHRDLVVMSTYHLGQIAIIAGLVLR